MDGVVAWTDIVLKDNLNFFFTLIASKHIQALETLRSNQRFHPLNLTDIISYLL